jgi:bifunctional N-acetylglucosamine-1-phosphate-uridyltransferase/glucosamine-1-phosphate-acetyltransferase GlmU-like protein
MRRVLIVPAAGVGSRLHTNIPKLLVPVAGRAMIDHLIDLYDGHVDTFVVVIAPGAEPAVREHLTPRNGRILYAIQESPTGMLDAILIPATDPALRTAPIVWITWCDQIAIHPRTVRSLAAQETAMPAPDLWFPTVTRSNPYTHLARDAGGRITAILHRREGDPMPEAGESESGLFAMTGETYRRHLPEYAVSTRPGSGTAERNFLPFIPWMASRGTVRTFPSVDETEAVGVNTPEELRLIERYLTNRATV